MCGIFGAVSALPVEWSAGASAAALAELRHRGPDAEGVWSDAHCLLGHTRLAILDLSPAGVQPMSSPDGALHVSFNGEIYNFAAVRAELEGLGHTFRSRSDTEVLLHGWQQWGPDCLRRFRGMFAAALWDARARSLFLARDRVGKKPLYYARRGGRLCFASEPAALLALLGDTPAPDLEALDAYLSWGYVPSPGSAFSGVARLEPARWLSVDVRVDGSLAVSEPQRYWTLEYLPKLALPEREAAEELRARLREAVRLRMISDVPLGAFLSGGIDSSVVVGLMAEQAPGAVRTFSIGFEESEFTELEHAREVSRRWKTDHHELVVRAEAAAVLPELARRFGEPFADDSALPTYYLARMTRRDVTVALSGDGGDESFVGYERYRATALAERLRRWPGGAAAARALATVLPDPTRARGRMRRLARFAGAAALSLPQRYGAWVGGTVGGFSAAQKIDLYTPELREAVSGAAPGRMEALFAATNGLDPAEAAGAVDVASYLPDDLLVKTDITSMCHGLEVRCPLLDTGVMELAARLPLDLKLRGGKSKYLLRRACADLIPPTISRRGKMGFGSPIAAWLRGRLRPMAEDLLLSDRARARGYFRPAAVRALLAGHAAGEADHSLQLWSLMMLELWHRELADLPPPT